MHCVCLHLQDSEEKSILNKLLKGYIISFDDAEDEAERTKAINTAKAALVKEVRLGAWEDVQHVLPGFADPDLLKYKKENPCQTALK